MKILCDRCRREFETYEHPIEKWHEEICPDCICDMDDNEEISGTCNYCGEEGSAGDWRYDKLRETSYCVKCEEQYWQDIEEAEGDDCWAIKH